MGGYCSRVGGPNFIAGFKLDGTVVVAGAVVGGTTPELIEENTEGVGGNCLVEQYRAGVMTLP